MAKKNLVRLGKLVLFVGIGNFTVDCLASWGAVKAQETEQRTVTLTDNLQGSARDLETSRRANSPSTVQPAAFEQPTFIQPEFETPSAEHFGEATPLMPRFTLPAEVSSTATPAQDCDIYLVPTPTLTPSMSLPEFPVGEHALPWRDEVLIDGGDRDVRVHVNENWKIKGLDIEDTVAHFDTLSGKRLVQPSNRVGIYAPRFRAVRKVANMVDAQRNMRMALVDEHTLLQQSSSLDMPTTSLQQLQPQRNRLAMTAGGFRDETRSVLVENAIHVGQFEHKFKAYENLLTIRSGQYDGSDKARLAESIQSAATYDGDLEVLSAVSNLRLIEAKDTKVFSEQRGVRNQLDKPALRLVKVASKMGAEIGEEVEFTLRFDNVGNQEIGNVTILDNLTGRLEYVEGSGQCSLDGNLFTKSNLAGSTELRWEITNPLPVGEGGIIRFKCIVR